MIEFQKNDREVVRVSVEEFKGRHLLNIRTWYYSPEGMRPSRSGITLHPDQLPQLADALRQIEASADYQTAVRGGNNG